MRLPVPLSFDWDRGNLEKSQEKHSVSYKEAEEIFFNKALKVFSDLKHSKNEKRFVALGKTNSKRQLTVIFTFRGSDIRIISARDQSKRERKAYEKNI